MHTYTHTDMHTRLPETKRHAGTVLPSSTSSARVFASPPTYAMSMSRPKEFRGILASCRGREYDRDFSAVRGRLPSKLVFPLWQHKVLSTMANENQSHTNYSMLVCARSVIVVTNSSKVSSPRAGKRFSPPWRSSVSPKIFNRYILYCDRLTDRQGISFPKVSGYVLGCETISMEITFPGGRHKRRHLSKSPSVAKSANTSNNNVSTFPGPMTVTSVDSVRERYPFNKPNTKDMV